MIKNIFLIIILFVTTNLFSLGIGDSRMETSYGSLLDNYSGDHITIQLPNNSTITDVVSFYFYDGYIIAKTSYNNYEKNTYKEEYFIANEVTSKIEKFSIEEKWKQELEVKKLTPKLWTRWYNQIPDTEILLFLLIIYFPIALVLYLFLKKIKNKDITTKVFLFLTIIFLLSFILNKFPQSI